MLLQPTAKSSGKKPPAQGTGGVVTTVPPKSASEVVDVMSKMVAVSTSLFAADGELVHAVDGLALFAHPASAAPQVVALEAVADACRTTDAAFAT